MFTIKEVANKMNVSEHTIRFWANSDLFPFVQRDKNNTRRFSEKDLEWVRIVKCLRAVGTDNKSIKKYVNLCLIGDVTIPERYEIIKNTKLRALKEIEELKTQLEVLDYKEAYYQNLIENKANDKFNPMNNAAEKLQGVAKV